MIKRKRSVAFILLLAFLVCQVTSLAAPGDETLALDERWATVTSAKDGQYSHISRADATTWLSGELTRLAVDGYASLDSTSTPDLGKVLTIYGSYLAYLAWIPSRVQESGGVQYTLFRSPGLTDELWGRNCIDIPIELRQKIIEKDILPDISHAALDVELLSADSMDSEFIGNRVYLEAINKLIHEYVELNILDILLRDTEISSSAEIDETAIAALASSVKGKVEKYFKVYNQIYSAYTSSVSRVLMNEQYTLNDDGTLQCIPFNGELKDSSYTKLESKFQEFNYESYFALSPIVKQLYDHLYGAEVPGDIKVDETINVNLDESDGVLPLISTARLVKGEVTFDDESNKELLDLGYVILSAGAVYDPFVSVAGNDAFLATVSKFLPSGKDEQYNKVVEILEKAINIKKPLYVSTVRADKLNSEEALAATSDYEVAFLAHVMSTDFGQTRIFATVKGSALPSRIDSSTVDYVRGMTTEEYMSGAAIPTDSMIVAGNNLITGSSMSFSKPIMLLSKEVASWWSQWDSNVKGVLAKRTASCVGGLTYLILTNAQVDAKSNKHIQQSEKERLFINGLGDIVLADNTIVLPAIANPLLYYTDSDVGIVYEVEDIEENVEGYYPYNAAFMNHYPPFSIGADYRAQLQNDNEVGKLLMGKTWDKEDNRLFARAISSVDKGKLKTQSTKSILTSRINSNSFTFSNAPTTTIDYFDFAEASISDWFGSNILNSELGSKMGLTDRTYDVLVKGGTMSMSAFPLAYTDPDMLEDFVSISGAVVTSVKRYICSEEYKTTGNFNVLYFIEEMMGQGLLGTQYTEALIKNSQVSYDQIVNDTQNRFVKLLVGVTNSVLNNVGNIDGVLAIKDGYENEFFNKIVELLQQFYVLLAVCLLLILAVKFFKGHCSMMYLAMLSLMVFAGFQVYVVWMPTMVPGAYNLIVSDIVENLVWNTTIHKAESYSETYLDSDRKDTTTGRLKPYTSTITLYRMSDKEIKTAADRLNIPYSDIYRGDIVYLDDTAGIFIQGDSIKMSIDTLFSNNPMRGLYDNQWDKAEIGGELLDDDIVYASNVDNPYSIRLTAPYVSLESYYTPFCEIERAFMSNLNAFAAIFMMERSYFSYSKDFYKDAFLFNSYTNSAIFTAPGDDDKLMQNFKPETIEGSRTALLEDILKLCHRRFDPQEDWLNLRAVFSTPSEAMQDSMWGQMMWRNKYYNPWWELTEDGKNKVEDLILYINNHTKQFVIDNQKELNFCSDENAIKIVSLYATTCFTHRMSSFGNWVYPNYINASELSLKDILYGAMSSLEDRNTASDGDVVNTVAINQGFLGVLMVLLITLLSVAFIFILTYLVPILYSLFGGILIYKLLNDEEKVGLIKGYLKVTAVTIGLYIIYSLGLQLVMIGGYRWYGFLGTLLVTGFCLFLLVNVIISVAQNFSELGNNTIISNLLKVADNMTRGLVSKVQTTNLNFNRNRTENYRNSYNTYRRNSSIDSLLPRAFSGRNRYRDGRYREEVYDHGEYKDNWFDKLYGGTIGRTRSMGNRARDVLNRYRRNF